MARLSDIINPIFNKNNLFGVKLFDYLDWCEIAKFMIDGKHLTIELLNLV